MSRLFDKNNLTQQQAERWDAAIETYEQVRQQERNALNQYLGANSVATDAHRTNSQLRWNQPGDENSALFSRLLDGKEPLAHPPPTCYGYPWYACIEDKGPLEVCLELASAHADDKALDPSLYIAQCRWRIEEENQPANDLRQLYRNAQMVLSPSPSGGQFSKAYQALESEAKQLLKRSPEWIVRYQNWHRFRVYLGRGEGRCRRRLFDRDLLRPDFSGGNKILIQSEEQGDTTEEPLFLRWFRLLKNRLHWPYDASLVKKLGNAAKNDKTSNDYASKDEEPGADMVSYTCDAWMLESLTPPHEPWTIKF